MRADSGTRGGRPGFTAAITVAAVAVAGTLAACSSSGSTAMSAGSPTTPGGTAAAKEFCEDLREVSIMAAPPAGSPMTDEDLALFDRLLAEAPPAVKNDIKAADNAVHSQAKKVTAEGMQHVGDAMRKVSAWASNPAHCPAALG